MQALHGLLELLKLIVIGFAITIVIASLAGITFALLTRNDNDVPPHDRNFK